MVLQCASIPGEHGREWPPARGLPCPDEGGHPCPGWQWVGPCAEAGESEFTWILDLRTSKRTKKCSQMRFLQNSLEIWPPCPSPPCGSALIASGSPWAWLPLGTVQGPAHPSLHVLRSRGSLPQPHRPQGPGPTHPRLALPAVPHVRQTSGCPSSVRAVLGLRR